MRFEKILIPAGLLIALCAAAAGAQTISAPPAVLADGDGAFAYTVEATRSIRWRTSPKARCSSTASA